MFFLMGIVNVFLIFQIRNFQRSIITSSDAVPFKKELVTLIIVLALFESCYLLRFLAYQKIIISFYARLVELSFAFICDGVSCLALFIVHFRNFRPKHDQS